MIGLSIVLYMSSLLLVESFDLRPSNEYILVRVKQINIELFYFNLKLSPRT
jgi:hypothetical protein